MAKKNFKQNNNHNKPNSDLIFGIHPVEEAIFNRVPIQQLFFLQSSQNNSVGKIERLAQKRKIKYFHAEPDKMAKLSCGQVHQGVIAKIEPFKYANLNTVLDSVSNKTESLFVILDHINDAGNLGAIARSAEAVGAESLIIPNRRSAQVTSTTYKTSAGAITHLPIVCVANIASTIQKLQQANFWVAAATEHAQTNIWEQNLKGKLAIVMGAEHHGVSQLALKKCDFGLRLPMRGKIESLNVAQAFSVFAYEWVRQNFNN